MKRKHLQEVKEKLSDLKPQLNQVLADNGFPHLIVNNVTFDYLPCQNGKCPPGLVPTPVYDKATGQYDLCACLPPSTT